MRSLNSDLHPVGVCVGICRVTVEIIREQQGGKSVNDVNPYFIILGTFALLLSSFSCLKAS